MRHIKGRARRLVQLLVPKTHLQIHALRVLKSHAKQEMMQLCRAIRAVLIQARNMKEVRFGSFIASLCPSDLANRLIVLQVHLRLQNPRIRAFLAYDDLVLNFPAENLFRRQFPSLHAQITPHGFMQWTIMNPITSMPASIPSLKKLNIRGSFIQPITTGSKDRTGMKV